jgi:hypothetical protein
MQLVKQQHCCRPSVVHPAALLQLFTYDWCLPSLLVLNYLPVSFSSEEAPLLPACRHLQTDGASVCLLADK